MSTLSLEHISVAANGKTLVRDVSLTVSSGEVHILMGPNGSGKSSLLNALMGHPKYAITEGKILLDTEVITTLPTEEKAKKGLFLSLQHLPEIAGVTLTNFLHRASKEIKGGEESPLEFYRRMRALAESAGIDPDFLKKHVNSGLSGGEKKQSEILQLLALAPKFAFLDEIDSGVDVDAMKRVYKAITQCTESGIGIVLVSHHPNILAHISADRVHVLQNGTLVASGGEELAEQIGKEGFASLPV